MAVIIICIVQVIYLEKAMQARGKYANVRNSKLFIHYILHIALAVQLGVGNGTLTTIRRTKYIQSQKEWASCT